MLVDGVTFFVLMHPCSPLLIRVDLPLFPPFPLFIVVLFFAPRATDVEGKIFFLYVNEFFRRNQPKSLFSSLAFEIVGDPGARGSFSRSSSPNTHPFGGVGWAAPTHEETTALRWTFLIPPRIFFLDSGPGVFESFCFPLRPLLPRDPFATSRRRRGSLDHSFLLSLSELP